MQSLRKMCGCVCVVVFLLSSIGCESQERIASVQYEREFYQPFMQASAIPAKQVELPDYRLNVADQLEIIFHVRHVPTDEYRFHTEDVIMIQFPFHPEYNQTVTIPPDGKIRLLLLPEGVDTQETLIQPDGTVRRIGKKVSDLQQELQAHYRQYLRDPELTVSFDAANVKIEELKRAITTAPRGQSRLMPVKPDGKITLPFLTDTLAYGKTIEELKWDLNRKYVDVGIPELEVTVQIYQVAPRRIYVMGEVFRPGLLEVDNMITLTHALTMAGGPNTRADAGKVLVIRRKHLPVAEGVIVDVEKMLTTKVTDDGISRPDVRAWTRDFWLDDLDLVYVPPSRLTRCNDWVEQVFTRGIYGVIPFSTNVGLNFGYQIRNAPTTVRTEDGSRWGDVVGTVIRQQQ